MRHRTGTATRTVSAVAVSLRTGVHQGVHQRFASYARGRKKVRQSSAEAVALKPFRTPKSPRRGSSSCTASDRLHAVACNVSTEFTGSETLMMLFVLMNTTTRARDPINKCGDRQAVSTTAEFGCCSRRIDTTRGTRASRSIGRSFYSTGARDEGGTVCRSGSGESTGFRTTVSFGKAPNGPREIRVLASAKTASVRTIPALCALPDAERDSLAANAPMWRTASHVH